MSKENCTLQERNLGIDLLRILAMFMIVMWHLLGHGGVLNATEVFSNNYKIAWLMKIFASCAVNIYAIISGYVMFGREQKIYNLIKLWGKVVFYSVSITLILGISGYFALDLKTILEAVMPISTGAYWYFTAYTVLFLTMPILNKAVAECSKKEVGNAIIYLFVLFSIITTFFEKDIFHLKGGYSAIWLIYLYLIGAYVKRYEQDFKNVSKCECIIGITLMVGMMWILKCIPQTYNYKYLVEYVSPSVFAMSVFYMLSFGKISLNRKYEKIIKPISNATFGVYLIHDNNLIRKFFITDRFVQITELSTLKFVYVAIVTALAIYIICTIIELIRNYIFEFCANKILRKRGEIIERKN